MLHQYSTGPLQSLYCLVFLRQCGGTILDIYSLQVIITMALSATRVH